MIKKHGLFVIFLTVFSLLLFGCKIESDSDEKSPGNTSKMMSLTVRIDTPNGSNGNMVAPLYSTQNTNFSQVNRITVEVRLDGKSVISPKEMTKNGSSWSVVLDGILLNRNYSFIARAYENDVETFNGSHSQSFSSENNIQISIPLTPTDDIYLAVPRITQIIRPEKLLAEASADVKVTVMGSSDETLSYEFKKDSSNDLGTFTSSTGQIALAGSTGVFVSSYQAPATLGSYNFSVMVSNTKNNSVESSFQIAVNGAETSVSLQVAPVVQGIHIKCSNNQLIWTATAVGYDGTDSQLSWQWTFDGSSDAFQNPTENGATLSNYTRDLTGPVQLTVTDENASGTTTVVTWQLEQNFCPIISNEDPK